MVEPKSNWVHVEGVECELFDQAHIPNGWMSGWGDGKTFHYHIPPPAPPRSEQEITWAHVVSGCDHLNPSIREHDGRMMETLCACSRCIAAALEGAARDAAKKERERCCAAVCLSCAWLRQPNKRQMPLSKSDGLWVHLNEDGDVWGLCSAAAIRALPPEEGK